MLKNWDITFKNREIQEDELFFLEFQTILMHYIAAHNLYGV